MDFFLSEKEFVENRSINCFGSTTIFNPYDHFDCTDFFSTTRIEFIGKFIFWNFLYCFHYTCCCCVVFIYYSFGIEERNKSLSDPFASIEKFFLHIYSVEKISIQLILISIAIFKMKKMKTVRNLMMQVLKSIKFVEIKITIQRI